MLSSNVTSAVLVVSDPSQELLLKVLRWLMSLPTDDELQGAAEGSLSPGLSPEVSHE